MGTRRLTFYLKIRLRISKVEKTLKHWKEVMYPLGKVDNKIFLNFSNLMPQSEFIFEIPGDLPRIF